MMRSRFVWAFATSFCLILTSICNADLAVTNGDFEASGFVGAGDGPQNITDWFDSTANFSSWEFGENVDAADDTTIALSTAGWMYQSLGNYNAANGTVLNISAQFTTGTTFDDAFEFEVFGGSFAAAAEGVDILGNAGQPTSVGSFSILPAAAGTSGGTVDLSGVADGTEVWLRVGGGGFERIDDVTLNVSAVPEPASCAWCCLGLWGLVGFRRRQS